MSTSSSTTRATAQRLAQSVARGLRDAGTGVVYGVPGGGNNLEVIEACEDVGLRFVLAHGETAAAIMASVSGELTGAPGACVVTRGPGAASAVNGVTQALLDRAPLALVADAVGHGERARVSHQRLDQGSLFRPVAKWAGTIGADGADRTVAAALALATAPPRGPVVLEFVPDAPTAGPPPAAPLRTTGDRDRARRLLRRSRRPVLAVGVGARGAIAELRELVDGTTWPVLTTYKAKGAIPETWPNAAGLLTGGSIEGPVLEAADLIVAIGLDAVELVPGAWPYPAPVVALAEWPAEDAYFTPEVELVGPLAELLELVAAEVDRGLDGAPFGRGTRLAAQAELVDLPGEGIGPQHVVLAARALAPMGSIATVDSGAHMLVTMPLWEVADIDESLISSGLATMGFALPAAIAAAVARRNRHVVCFTGDGGLGMTLAELETVARIEVPIVVVVFNDGALSLIEIKQKPGGHGGHNAVRYRAIDFAAIAAGVGVASQVASTRDELALALTAAFAARRPFLVDVRLDAKAYPHVMSTIRGRARA
jgi:acetolactate synthase-1/2/3 large subunit